MSQIELHQKIDALMQKDPPTADLQEVRTLVAANEDAKGYFFSRVDERWLDWLWENGFLDVIKQKAEDPTQYGYQMPELNYLVRVSEKVPEKVADIMLQIPISAETFNPEVIDRFSRICSGLPAKQLARVVPNILKQNWIPLMGPFNRFGFEYEKMLNTLAEAKDYESILMLAEAILTVRPREEVAKEGFAGISTENPFYFNDLSYTKVFEHLALMEDIFAVQALDLTTKTISQIVLLGGETEDNEVFSIRETFHLYDVDFFTLELGKREHLSHRDDVRELAAVIKILSEKTIGSHDTDPWRGKELYEKYFKQLPDSRSMWRLRLFVLTLYPKYFRDELKAAFFKLFVVERYYEITSGAEYEKALREGFDVLSEKDKQEYVKQVINYFVRKDKAKENEKEDWHIRYGSRILSMVAGFLDEHPELKRDAEKAGFTIDPSYEPQPSISETYAGTVVPQAPGDDADWKKPVPDIVGYLKTKWSAEELKKRKESEDFFRPVDIEGTGERLKRELAARPAEFLENAQLFFDRTTLDLHYTYSFLRGLYDLMHDKKIGQDANFANVLALLDTIAGEKEFEPQPKEPSRWTARWDAVHNAMADVVQELLGEGRGDDGFVDFGVERNRLFRLVEHLLSYRDPAPKDEEIEEAKIKEVAASNQFVSDPFTNAINSVRGRAFQAFVAFVYLDGKTISEKASVKIKNDVKELYKSVLRREETRAIMFMFGHYLPSFYYRDAEWLRGLLPDIFSAEPEKKHLYVAAWEGYLANNLYKEIFFDDAFQKLYERGIGLETDEETKRRRYFRNPDEGIATHFALAHMYYEEFGLDHPLFVSFWNKKDTEQHGAFISFIGRAFVSGDNRQNNELLKSEPRAGARLRGFWDWILKREEDSKTLTEFGAWIDLEKGIFEAPWLAAHIKATLERTRGTLDWEYGLTKSIIQLASEAPEDTLEVARLYLLESGVRGGENKRFLFHVDNEWYEAFKVLFANPKAKKGTYKLIDDLIRNGGSPFWGLKKILTRNGDN
jgi:hypothetical protein